MNDASDRNDADDDDQEPPSKERRIVRFTDLSSGKSELLIEHQGRTYLLRVTKNGKLLLNK